MDSERSLVWASCEGVRAAEWKGKVGSLNNTCSQRQKADLGVGFLLDACLGAGWSRRFGGSAVGLHKPEIGTVAVKCSRAFLGYCTVELARVGCQDQGSGLLSEYCQSRPYPPRTACLYFTH